MAENGDLAAAALLGLALVASVLLAGCAGSNGGGSNSQADVNCQTTSGQQQRTSGVKITCEETSGAAIQRESFECEDATMSAVHVATNMTAGSVQIEALDANSTIIFERNYTQTGPYNETERIDEGEAGEWTLIAERTEDFNGSYGAQLACAQER